MATEITNPPPFEYPASLQEYMIPEKEYFKQHPEYQALCTGIVVFDKQGKLLLVQRASTEKAFPDFWEIPGGKVDDTDETLLHGAVRELKEETGLEATRIVRKVSEFWFDDRKVDGRVPRWVKHIFEMEVKDLGSIKVDPVEHQAYLFASEEDVIKEKAGDVELKYITPDNKVIKLEAFRHRRKETGA
ncbi:hypothetical protein K458DRAFT_418096 [Lentithecium fluviatile CBS 122367]|uniref:Nudix hydrolase domain-containing protein n=1 Tax=Lentithecium fluviatile CBS 122367 TaxID=1168545 RepID=A0A6G1J1Z2_9PLEO|nr:hypothetical protein K458DRAFT_418096 [Lentithecium fluviatile CBS 122367]